MFTPFKDFTQIISGKADMSDISCQYTVFEILPIAMLMLAFCYNSPQEIAEGMGGIIKANDMFVTDYLYIASPGAALFNSGLATLALIKLLKKLDLKLNGMIIAGIFMTAGFSFVGKNMYNIWSFYVGGYAYSRVHELEFKSVIGTCIFSASLAPIVSVVTFAVPGNPIFGIISGYAVGGFLGYIMPKINSHLLNAHSGYSLYNTGFAAGFIAGVAQAGFRMFGIAQTGLGISCETVYLGIYALFTAYFIFLLAAGFYYNDRSFKNYKEIFNYSGRLITDYTRLSTFPITILNIGVMGLIGMGYIYFFEGVLNASLIAGLMAVAGFGSFGVNPLNSFPVMMGVYAATFFFNTSSVSRTIIITIGLFSTSLAPIAGEYGIFIGMLTGAIHLSVTLSTPLWHEGLNLYNNGFSAGIVAMLAIPIFDALKIKRWEDRI